MTFGSDAFKKVLCNLSYTYLVQANISIMKNLLQYLAFFSTVLTVLASTVHDQPLCCGNESIALERSDKCEDNQIPLPQCSERADYLLSYIRQFGADNRGTYFIAENDHQVYSPNYCIANQTVDLANNSQLVLYCSNNTSDSSNASTTEEDSKNLEFMEWLIWIEKIFCIGSGVLLALTALIYFITPQTRDIEGKCTFHLILTQCLFHFLGAFMRIANDNQLTWVDNFCITHWYVAVFIQLSYFMWCAILLHYMWKRFRQNFREDDPKLMIRYRIVGYGIPFLLLALCSLHAHLYSFLTKKDFERDCKAHRVLLIDLYGSLPIIILECLCAFFFACLQRNLWTMQPARSYEISISSFKKFRFRLLMMTKLFTITGLPWLLILFLGMLSKLTSSSTFHPVIRGIFTFITSEGIILFYILVIGRQHVYRGLAGKFGITVRRWEQNSDSEESSDSGDESESEFNREL